MAQSKFQASYLVLSYSVCSTIISIFIVQKAEVDKTAASLRAAAAQQESAKVALQQQLSDRMK